MLEPLLGPLPVPGEYPLQHHRRLHELVTAFAAAAPAPHDYLAEFHAALSGLVSRYRACNEACLALEAAARDGDASPQRLTYSRDRDVFAFILNGVAAIATLSYAAYAAGAMFWPHLFPFGSEAARRAVGPRGTARAFDLAGQTEFAALVNGVLDSADFRTWDKYRNAVTHRGMPGEDIAAGDMLRWLGATLSALMAGLVRVAEGQGVRLA